MSAPDSQAVQQLSGQVALVTGAAGGLGAALTAELARHGATVIACDVDREGLGDVVAQSAGSVHPQLLDLTDFDAIERCTAEVIDQHGDFDIVVHAAIRHFAGDDGHEPRGFTEHTPAQILETLAVAITGPTLLTNLVAQRMIERRTGRIVFTGSMHRSGTAGLVMYAAGKAYINALARGLFLELRAYDVTTLVSNPGGMHTGLHQHRDPWMLEPRIVAEAVVNSLLLPGTWPCSASTWCLTTSTIPTASRKLSNR